MRLKIKPQWKTFVVWVSAVLIVILATVFYRPAAARTGSLLVWTNDRVYVMDIDTLTLERVGEAAPYEAITPSPGCFGQTETACWVVVSHRLYQVTIRAGSSKTIETQLPVEEGFQWNDGEVSWSPDGIHLSYSVLNLQTDRAELRVYNSTTGEIKIKAPDVDSTVAAVWTAGCAEGLTADTCELGYKKLPTRDQPDALPVLVGFLPASQTVRQWSISPEEIFELRWSSDGDLLYSRPKRHFIKAKDHTAAYQIPEGAKLAGMSPDALYTIYYQPFFLGGCRAAGEEDRCMHLGVWLKPKDTNEQALIYNVDLAEQTGGLNFIPVWASDDNSFVFFQEGRLIYYNMTNKEATIWYKSLNGKLRSVPVFSPNEEAVAFVDNQGKGFSEYRLLVVNPRLQPVKHIIETEKGFKVLAWLPD